MSESLDKRPEAPSAQAQVYIADLAAFAHKTLASARANNGLGRPYFEGEVSRWDQDVADFWIGLMPDLLKGLNVIGMYACVTYLSDLSDDYDRGGSIFGLLGPDADVRSLRVSLLRELQTTPPPTEGAQAIGVPTHLYLDAFEALAARAVGPNEFNAFTREHDNNNLADVGANPYLQIHPDVKYALIQPLIAATLQGLE